MAATLPPSARVREPQKPACGHRCAGFCQGRDWPGLMCWRMYACLKAQTSQARRHSRRAMCHRHRAPFRPHGRCRIQPRRWRHGPPRRRSIRRSHRQAVRSVSLPGCPGRPTAERQTAGRPHPDHRSRWAAGRVRRVIPPKYVWQPLRTANVRPRPTQPANERVVSRINTSPPSRGTNVPRPCRRRDESAGFIGCNACEV